MPEETARLITDPFWGPKIARQRDYYSLCLNDLENKQKVGHFLRFFFRERHVMEMSTVLADFQPAFLFKWQTIPKSTRWLKFRHFQLPSVRST